MDVLENNGTHAWVRVHLTIHMKDGHVLQSQVLDDEFLYDASRDTWMFDYSPWYQVPRILSAGRVAIFK